MKRYFFVFSLLIYQTIGSTNNRAECFQYEDRNECLESCFCNWCSNINGSLCIDTPSISNCRFSGGTVDYYEDTDYCQRQTKIIIIGIVLPVVSVLIICVFLCLVMIYPNSLIAKPFVWCTTRCYRRFIKVEHV